jgi:hypothetical protein
MVFFPFREYANSCLEEAETKAKMAALLEAKVKELRDQKKALLAEVCVCVCMLV